MPFHLFSSSIPKQLPLPSVTHSRTDPRRCVRPGHLMLGLGWPLWYLEICWPTKWTERNGDDWEEFSIRSRASRRGKSPFLSCSPLRIRSIYYRLNYHNTLYRWLLLASAAEMQFHLSLSTSSPSQQKGSVFRCDCVSETDEALMFKLTVKFSFALVDPPTKQLISTSAKDRLLREKVLSL